MGLFGKGKFRVTMDGPGRLVYREGNSEFVFPIYETDREIVVVGEPSNRRIHFFFGWYHDWRTISKREKERILPRLVEHFAESRLKARVLEREEDGFVFHPELFEERARASEALEESGIAWLSDYGSIDLLHEEYGLEVCGIHEKENMTRVAEAMQAAFPHWHFGCGCFKDYGREAGWKFKIYMWRRKSKGGRTAEKEE
jgi:hypothetical protein